MAIESINALALAGSMAMSGGGSGLLSIPDANIMPLNTVEFQHSNGVVIHPTRMPELSQVLNDHVQFAPMPGFEFGARLSTWYRKDTGRRTLNDLNMHAKIRVYHDENLSLAIGSRDFAGEAVQQSPAYFAVGNWNASWWKASLGFGTSKTKGAQLDGVFGGVAMYPLSWLGLMADYDGAESQVGFQVHHDYRRAAFYLKGMYSTQEDHEVVYAAGVRWHLGQGERAAQPQVLAQATGSSRSVAGASEFSRIEFGQRPWGGDELSAHTLAWQGSCAGSAAYSAFGLPLLAVDCEDQGGEISWTPRKIDWQHWHVQLRVEPALRYAIGTEVGRADYSIAARASLHGQLPFGLGGYAAWDVPVDDSEFYEEGEVFGGSRFESGLYEAAMQWTAHPVSGLLTQLTGGRTTIQRRDIQFYRLESAWMFLQGRAALDLSWTRFDVPEQGAVVAQSQTLAKAFVWLAPARYALQLTGGEFLYADQGVRMDLFKYIGRTRLGLYYKHGDAKAVGMNISIALTGRKALSYGHVSLTGAPHFQPSLETQIASGTNTNPLLPSLMNEFTPQRDLIDEVLDQWRISPNYLQGR